MADYAPHKPTAPLTSIGQELGILFAFSGFMVACLVAYWIGWNRTFLARLATQPNFCKNRPASFTTPLAPSLAIIRRRLPHEKTPSNLHR